jgi:hypothetical protein
MFDKRPYAAIQCRSQRTSSRAVWRGFSVASGSSRSVSSVVQNAPRLVSGGAIFWTELSRPKKINTLVAEGSARSEIHPPPFYRTT